MHRILILASFAAIAFAQDPADLFNRAPADVDRALRARITEFFHYHVTGEPRKAEQLVAEDTQDYFYNNNKPRYISFEINRIDYSDGYTKAKAMVTIKMAVMLPGFNGKVMDIPTPSYWKLENGKWCWFLTKAQQNASPMGEMKPGPPSVDGVAPVKPTIPATFEELWSQVKADKNTVSVGKGSTDRIVIANSFIGPIDLTVKGKPDGIEAVLDHTQIKSGEKAVLTVKALDGAKAGDLSIYVLQTQQTIPVKVLLK